ncbi:protein Wnt-11 isoform X1 [Oryzias latipes]|uniref:Protein Wnt n=2 Tax=Oryzias latipes TaxID=8090 RepID=A0A3P9KXW9_ORYLA|nr:protein Wnt-11 isoform X1 [Oryzias latipes]XP_011482115.1 protein Wnt-11 isoform X1 [Oryzias latipes]
MKSRSHILPVGVLTALLLSQVCSGIKWLTLSQTTSHINQTQHCKRLSGLVSSQVQLCRSNLELMQTIVQAAREVKKTCQKTFADMRWNCSSIEIAADGQKYPPDLDRGTREAAFVYALSAATISHTIARACTSGDLRLCTCGPIPAEIPEPGYRWGGCADNLHYGLMTGSKFSDAPMKMKRSGSHANKLMHLHNSEVGRQVLRESMVMKCKCHGVSGSCSIRTCWRGLQDLREIAMDLKTKYLSATKVIHRPMGTRKQLVPKDIDIRPVRENELVYLQSSPDFCSKNEKLGSVGTQDRQCNKTSVGSDSCDLMCCGRGYNPYTEKLVERCHCKYHWCCYVTCKKCERIVERYVCK